MPENIRSVSKDLTTTQDSVAPATATQIQQHKTSAMRIKAPATPNLITQQHSHREKMEITLELDKDLIAHLRASGSDWQIQVNNLLRKTMI